MLRSAKAPDRAARDRSFMVSTPVARAPRRAPTAARRSPQEASRARRSGRRSPRTTRGGGRRRSRAAGRRLDCALATAARVEHAERSGQDGPPARASVKAMNLSRSSGSLAPAKIVPGACPTRCRARGMRCPPTLRPRGSRTERSRPPARSSSSSPRAAARRSTRIFRSGCERRARAVARDAHAPASVPAIGCPRSA